MSSTLRRFLKRRRSNYKPYLASKGTVLLTSCIVYHCVIIPGKSREEGLSVKRIVSEESSQLDSSGETKTKIVPSWTDGPNLSFCGGLCYEGKQQQQQQHCNKYSYFAVDQVDHLCIQLACTSGCYELQKIGQAHKTKTTARKEINLRQTLAAAIAGSNSLLIDKPQSACYIEPKAPGRAARRHLHPFGSQVALPSVRLPGGRTRVPSGDGWVRHRQYSGFKVYYGFRVRNFEGTLEGPGPIGRSKILRVSTLEGAGQIGARLRGIQPRLRNIKLGAKNEATSRSTTWIINGIWIPFPPSIFLERAAANRLDQLRRTPALK